MVGVLSFLSIKSVTESVKKTTSGGNDDEKSPGKVSSVQEKASEVVVLPSFIYISIETITETRCKWWKEH